MTKRADSYASSPATLKACWAELKPVCDEVARLVMTAPLAPDDKKYLGLYAMALMMGTAVALMQKAAPSLADRSISDVSEELLKILIPIMEQQETKMQH